MVPKLAAEGASFKGAFLYYCHDKDSLTSARVAWTETLNMMTEQVEKAWKIMTYTAKNAMRLKAASGHVARETDTVEKPVVSYSLSWSPEQTPDKDAMLEAAHQSIAKLGLTDHEAMIVAHQDEDHPHLHVVINRIHPLTGKAANVYRSQRKLSDFAREYERQHGKVYCMKREENYQKRQQGQHTRYNDPVIATAWQKSHNAFTFDRLLANKGYQLAQGRKRLVVVDPHDKAHNPVRHLKGIAKADEFHERMEGLNHDKLPTVETVVAARKIERNIHAQRLIEHEDKVADTLSKEFSRHYKEKEKLMERHARRIDRKASKLEDQYKLPEKQETIDQLNHQLENPNFVQKLSFKLFNADRKLADKINMLEKGKANAVQRLQEVITPMEKERDLELQSMEKRHARELEQVNSHLAGWKPRERTLSREWSQAAHVRDMTQDHRYDGPELSR